ncbi:MAG: N-acetyl sugar amidotransferase [Planctomycetes bacterium]|nr:N-acetyl sugar amidotransferase [Planctomycetota bacterium]
MSINPPGTAFTVSEYRICTQCVMDTSDPDIRFDEDGVCHHCHDYRKNLLTRVLPSGEREVALDALMGKMRTAGRSRDYDCIAGVSGGVDSTYAIHLARRLGLRVLAVHFDNGWNSELAVSNIENALKRLDTQLFTKVMDWEEFRQLQLAFLRSSTPDGEIPTDHAIYATLIDAALKTGVRYIVSGMNYATESSSVPAWSYGHSDWKYIRGVNRVMGGNRLRSFPHYSLGRLFRAVFLRRIRFISLLNYIDYDKSTAVETIMKELDWRDYGGKHHESVYTRFYQGYILPKKFGIDKRRAHLSDLMKAGKGPSREQALEELRSEPYPVELQRQDRDFIVKKFGLLSGEFEAIMKARPKTFRDYPNNFEKVKKVRAVVHALRARGLYPR